MLTSEFRMRVSDLEVAIGDYKAGLFSDREFVKEVGNIVAKLYVAINGSQIRAEENIAEEVEV